MWIGDQFSRDKAEQLSLQEIAEIFTPTPETPYLERATNHLVLGAKGSGKSILLQALTWKVWQDRTSESSPQFVGIYIPIRYEDASYFWTAYDELQDSILFEHFFVISFIYQLAIQIEDKLLSQQNIYNILIDLINPTKIEQIEDLRKLVSALWKERDLCISIAKNNPTLNIYDIDLITKTPLSISKIQYLSEQIISSFSFSSEEIPKRLGLLIDSLDYYGSLTSILAPLFESDTKNPIVIKAAARSIDVSEFSEKSRSRRLELDRDFEIITLDRHPDDPEHLQLLEKAICRRVRYNTPQQIKNLTNEQILNILFHDSTEDPDDVASFNSFSRLASGNILQIILLLDESATLTRTQITQKPDNLTPISRDARIKAIEQESRKFWDLEIGIRLPSKKHDAKVYCETLVEIVKEQADAEASLLSPSYTFESLPVEYQSLLSSLLSTRILIANDKIVHKTLQAGFPYSGGISLELNRLMLYKVGMRPLSGNNVKLNAKQFHNKFTNNLNKSKPYLSPRATQSKGTLFNPDFTVFMSIPFDKKKKNRTTILRKAINKIYEETTGKRGKEGLSYVDIHFIPLVGSFRSDIPNYINESTYAIADISEIALGPKNTSGVFYELGLIIGNLKPFALFYNSRGINNIIPKFDSADLPHLLSGQTVIVVEDSTSNFTQLFRPVHEKLIGYNGHLSHPFGVNKAPQSPWEKPYVYLSFQPRNENIYTWFAGIIKKIFPEIQIVKAPNWKSDEGPTLYQAIKNASFTIIDCTEGINNYAIELGICGAMKLFHTLEVWDSSIDRRTNPITMFPGNRLAWTDLDQNDERQATELIKHLARTTTLGTKRL